MHLFKFIRYKKEKATDDFTHLSPTVGFPYELSNKFIKDMQYVVYSKSIKT